MWAFEHACDNFGAVVEAAHSDALQVMARDGKAAAAFLSPEQYQEFLDHACRHGGPLTSIFSLSLGEAKKSAARRRSPGTWISNVHV